MTCKGLGTTTYYGETNDLCTASTSEEDIFLAIRDDIAKDEERIANSAFASPNGAGLVLIAKSIRILAYAIIMAAIVFSVNGIL